LPDERRSERSCDPRAAYPRAEPGQVPGSAKIAKTFAASPKHEAARGTFWPISTVYFIGKPQKSGIVDHASQCRFWRELRQNRLGTNKTL
jgi:hypothetical protein